MSEDQRAMSDAGQPDTLTREDLQRMRDAAVEASRLKSDFVANTSHEIRTPLNGIVGFVNLLLDTDLTRDQRRYADGLRLSAESLLGIVNDILDFSKIEAGMLRLEETSFDVRTILENTRTMFDEAAQRKHLVLEVHVSEGVDTRVKADPGRIRQIVTNLISNAIKFTDRGFVKLGVAQETCDEDTVTLRFRVSDTGMGIDGATQRRLFQPFVQADGSTGRQFGGTGLGLAICKQLVELMGGAIGVDSTEGFGSTFWFTVTLRRDTESVVAMLDPAVLQGKRMLVADDSASSRAEILSVVRAWGLSVDQAPSGGEALEHLRQSGRMGRPYDVAILSLANPEMDGMALARALKADALTAGVRLVLIPVAGMRGQAREARDAGIAAYLPRPIQGEELVRCLVTAVAEVNSEAEQALITRHTLGEWMEPAARRRILVVDDSALGREVAKLQIEKFGHVVDLATNGRDAVTAATSEPYDLILIDCQMPIMDGFAATREIRRLEAEGRRTPIVAVTANVVTGERERCLAAGMDYFVGKPVTKEALADMLTRHLGRARDPHRSVVETGLTLAEGTVDPGLVRELLEELGPARYAELVHRHLVEVEAMLNRFGDAPDDRDALQLGRDAHRVKWGSLTLGLSRLSEVCATLEDRAARFDADERRRALVELRAELARARRWCQQQFEEPRGTSASLVREFSG